MDALISCFQNSPSTAKAITYNLQNHVLLILTKKNHNQRLFLQNIFLSLKNWRIKADSFFTEKLLSASKSYFSVLKTRPFIKSYFISSYTITGLGNRSVFPPQLAPPDDAQSARRVLHVSRVLFRK